MALAFWSDTQDTPPVHLDTLFYHGDRKTNLKSLWHFKIFEKYFWKYFWKFFGTEKFKILTKILEISRFFEFFRENRKIWFFFQFKSSYKIFGFSTFEIFSNFFSKMFIEYFWNYRSTSNWFCDLRGEKVFLDRLARCFPSQNKYAYSVFDCKMNA